MALPQLRAASFRGVPFKVTGSTFTTGRSQALFDFPQTDGGGAEEDMGRQRRGWRLVGFVVGKDWRTQRDRLVRACETPGPGRLVHPTFGELDVVIPVNGCEVIEEVTELEQAAFRLTFLEHGALLFPTSIPSGTSFVETARSSLSASVSSDFASKFDAGIGGVVQTEAVASATSAVEGVRDSALSPLADLENAAEILEATADILNGVLDLILVPLEFSAALSSVFDRMEGLGAFDQFMEDAGSPTILYGEGTTDTARRINDNGRSIRDLVTRQGLGRAAEVAASLEFDSFDEAVSVRDSIASAISAEANIDGTSGTTYQALIDVRTRLAVQITERAADLATLRTFTPPRPLPSFLIAHETHGDASRSREIEKRNKAHAVIGLPVLVKND